MNVEPRQAQDSVEAREGSFRQLAPRHQPDPSDSERLVRQLASWCRANSLSPLSVDAVPGPTEVERAQLAALGGIARSLLGRAAAEAEPPLPAAVAAWTREAPQLPDSLLSRLRIALENGEDPLAQLYERLVAAPRRRSLGTFFTPSAISDYMTRIVQTRSVEVPATIADPGAGVGAFTRTALKAWPDAHVHAIDVNVVTLGLLAAALDAEPQTQKRLSLHHADFLAWMSEGWEAEPGPRLVWGNPPYTRHQSLSAKTKAAAKRAAGELAPGGRAGLSTYFLATALRNLGSADSLCLLLPANWLEAEYGAGLRKYLWKTTTRPVELHIFPHTLNLFPVAVVAAMVIWVGPSRPSATPMQIFSLEGSLDTGFSNKSVKVVDRTGVPPPDFFFSRKEANNVNFKQHVMLPLAEMAEVRRGVATGANHFFLLTDERAVRLPRHAYVPAATRLRDLVSDDLNESAHEAMGAAGARRWMLQIMEQDVSDPAVGRLIDQGKCERIHEAHLCASRNPWYSLERIPVPHLLFGPMAKGRFRIIRNTIGAIPTNTFYGIRFRQSNVSEAAISALAEWLRSDQGQTALANRARQHGSGTLKIEPRDLAGLHVPADPLQALDRG
ncbi:Eco57I restriction-modification methylase domain-containing protein [Micromonospora sp. H33]|uniref:Eco57I restriction-modification methylase domain-containing protein n=1 Tax=Micromonospora sp. H33 TaxID=3452215 RepID=UPI003F8909D3